MNMRKEDFKFVKRAKIKYGSTVMNTFVDYVGVRLKVRYVLKMKFVL